MHWALIILIVIAGIILYTMGIGLGVGLMCRIEGWSSDQDVVVLINMFFWWAIVIIILLSALADFIAIKVSGK